MGEKVDVLAWQPHERPAEYWEDQAQLALDYALARAPGDHKGFSRSLRDSAEFTRLAALARIGGAA